MKATTTITPKAITKTHYSFTTTTVTASCLHFKYPPSGPPVIKPRPGHNGHKARGYPPLGGVEIRDVHENVITSFNLTNSKYLEKRAFDPCIPEAYSLRPTATIYTNTVFTTTTVTFTSTETDTSTVTSTTTQTLATQTVTFDSCSL